MPQPDDTGPAETEMLAALAAVQPVLRDVVTAREALGLPDRALLHAGPPYRDPTRPPLPVLNAAALTCIHEGWAADPDGARKLIWDGGVALRPSRDFGAVVPLASVIGPSTVLVEVSDAAAAAGAAWCELSPGPGPLLRFGTAEPAVLEHLRFRDAVLAPALRQVLAEPLPLLPLARAGLLAGDDLHGRTTGATEALGTALAARGAAPDLLEAMAGAPLFFLTLWMAAVACILNAARDRPAPGLVTALAGNGEEIGLMRSDVPGRWFTAPAVPPDGPDPLPPEGALPAIGDSALIDALGFGGQAIDRSPELLEVFGPLLPDDGDARRAACLGPHPAFGSFDLRVGLVADRVAAGAAPPLVVIARLASGGGLIGRGLYRPPPALFAGP